MYEPPALPPPGWYPDPERAGALRWWTGTTWAMSSASFTASADELPEIGALIGGAFRRVLRRWRALLALSLLAGAVPSVLSMIAVGHLLDGVAVVDDELVGWSSDRVPGAIWLYGLAMLTGWIGTLAITWLMLHTIDDEEGDTATPPSTGDEMTAAVRALAGAAAAMPRAIGWGLVAALATAAVLAVVVGLIVEVLPLGILAAVALLPLAVWAGTKLAMLPHAVVDARGNPFRRSAVVSRERFWGVLGRVLILGVIASAINYGASTVGALASGGGAFGVGTPLEVDENGDLRDFELDELFPVTPLTVGAIAVSATASTMFGLSSVLAGLAVLYRTRNRRSS